jgi:hypothetical protein
VRIRGRRSALLFLIVSFVWALPARAPAQGTPPLEVRLFFKDPSPDPGFDATSPTTPVAIVVQLRNISGAPINTTQGFSGQEWWRRLFFVTPTGGTVTNTAEAAIHDDAPRTFACYSRGRILQRPTTIPVIPVEVLAGPTPPPGPPNPFFLEWVIDDARRFFNLRLPGRYTVRAQIPLLTFGTGDPDTVITDCDQFPGQTLVNVGPGVGTGRQAFTVGSNTLEFFIRGAMNVDAQVKVSVSGLVFNRVTNTFDTVATITNTSTDILSPPMSLVVTGIVPTGVTLANATGQSADGSPLVDVPVPTGGLAPGASVTNVVLKFSNPSRVQFSFTRSVLAMILP